MLQSSTGYLRRALERFYTGLLLADLGEKTSCTPEGKSSKLLKIEGFVEEGESMEDAVNNPSHYQSESGLEAIDVIDSFFYYNSYLANVFKYIARAGKKNDRLEDLKKAQWYLDREIQKLEAVYED